MTVIRIDLGGNTVLVRPCAQSDLAVTFRLHCCIKLNQHDWTNVV